MRPDLAKCTTESPRHGIRYARAFKLKFGGKVRISHEAEFDYPDEHGGFHSSARHRQPGGGKSFSDSLSALRGNIHVNVGRAWNDVYSEFCQVLDRRGISGYHIWTHLVQEVSIDTYLGRDGEVYEKPRRWPTSGYPVDGYYVHPITGILCYRPYVSYRSRWRDKKKEYAIPVPGMDGWKYEFMDGLWFRVKRVLQVGERVSPRGVFKTYEEWVIVTKRSASKKEIRWIREQIQRGRIGPALLRA